MDQNGTTVAPAAPTEVILPTQTVSPTTAAPAVTAVTVASSTQTAEPSEFHKKVAEYRNGLVASYQRMQGEFDKAVLVLSGGALGISMTFIKEILSGRPTCTGYFLGAWIFWGISICATFSSYFTSAQLQQKAIEHVDKKDIYVVFDEMTKSAWYRWTSWLNIAAGICFVLGVAMMIVFVGLNL
jgi:hypothetical protein